MLYSTPTQVPVNPVAIVQTLQTKSHNQDKPANLTYTVVENDTLTSIAEAHQTTIQRLWAANPILTDPNLIEPTQSLIVPLNTDVLQDRPLPTITPSISSSPVNVRPPSGGFSSSGNTYDAGQCTAFVKDQLSWVNNGWGNASSWVYTSGHRVSSVPIVGSIASGRSYSHVAIVRAVGNGTVTVEEQNYKGPFIVSTRVAPISEFQYILP